MVSTLGFKVYYCHMFVDNTSKYQMFISNIIVNIPLNDRCAALEAFKLIDFLLPFHRMGNKQEFSTE